MSLNDDFKRLAEKSGWTNARIAEECGVSPQYVGQILNGTSNVSEPVMKAFFLALLMKARNALVHGEGWNLPEEIMREVAPRGDDATWRTRAKTAEGKLEMLRQSLRELLEKSSLTPAPRELVSSAGSAEDEAVLDALEGGAPDQPGESSRLHEAGAPTAPSSPPSSAAGPVTKARRAAAKPAPKKP